MINNRLTYKRRLKHYNPEGETAVIRFDRNTAYASEPDEGGFIVGPAVDKLYAYEELGYEPEELRIIVEKYREFKCDFSVQKEVYKYLVNDLYNTEKIQSQMSGMIKNVIFNEPATIVFWLDGTKTVVKCQEGDTFDPEKGLAMAIAKKFFGNKGNYCNEIKKWTDTYDKPQPVDVKINLSIPNVKPCVEVFKKLNEQLKRHNKIDTDSV